MKKKIILAVAVVGILATAGTMAFIKKSNTLVRPTQGKYITLNQKYEMIGTVGLLYSAGVISISDSRTIVSNACSSNDIESDSTVGKLMIKILNNNTDKKSVEKLIKSGSNFDCSIF